MEITETKRFIPNGFELYTTSVSRFLVHCVKRQVATCSEDENALVLSCSVFNFDTLLGMSR